MVPEQLLQASGDKAHEMRAIKQRLLPGRKIITIGDSPADIRSIDDMEDAYSIGVVQSAEAVSVNALNAHFYVHNLAEMHWSSDGNTLTFHDVRQNQLQRIENVGAVVFDYDGTLGDTIPTIRDAYGRLSAALANAEPHQRDLYEVAHAMGAQAFRELPGRRPHVLLPRILEFLRSIAVDSVGRSARDVMPYEIVELKKSSGDAPEKMSSWGSRENSLTNPSQNLLIIVGFEALPIPIYTLVAIVLAIGLVNGTRWHQSLQRKGWKLLHRIISYFPNIWKSIQQVVPIVNKPLSLRSA